ncbi:SLC5 family protein [Bacteroidota bacterium]
MTGAGTLDIGIFIAYFIFVLFIGFSVGRKKKKSASDYFIASGRLKWYVIGFGIIATSISTEQLVASCGAAYKWGMPVLNWEMSNIVAIFIVMIILLPVYLNKKIVTIPHYLELRFGSSPRILYALITIFTIVFIYLAGVGYTGGFVLEQIFGIDKIYGIWLIVIIAGSFTIYGGLISVVWAQLFQGILLLIGGFLISGLGIAHIDGGLSTIIGTGERSHLIQPMSHPELPWTSIVILTLHVNIWYWGTNQQLIQSGLGAKSRWHGMMGVLFSGFLITAAVMAIEFPGLVAHALEPNLENTDLAYVYAAKILIPTGLKGLVFAGLVGAIMSTIQGLAQAASTVFSLELYGKAKKGISDAKLIRVGKICSAIILIFGALWAPMVGNWPNIFEFFTKCVFLISAPIASIFIWGILWKGTTKTAVNWTLILSFLFFVIPYITRTLEVKHGIHINEYNLAGILFVGSMLFTYLVSIFTKKPADEQIEGLVWEKSMIKLSAKDNRPIYRNIWFWSVLFLAIMIFIYAIYW